MLAFLSVCVVFLLGCVVVLHRNGAKKDGSIVFLKTVMDVSKPAYFLVDVPTGRMTSSKSLADLYGADYVAGKYTAMENFPEDAAKNDNVYKSDQSEFVEFYNNMKKGVSKEGSIMLRVLDSQYDQYVWSRATAKVIDGKDRKPQTIIGTLDILNYSDKLTGVNNRNKFEKDAEELIHKGNYAFAIIDIDNFKLFNEIYGYNAGDMLLKHIGKTLEHHIKDGETFSRDSADRFFVLMRYDGRSELVSRLKAIQESTSKFGADEDRRYHTGVCASAVLVEAEASVNNLANRAMMAKHNSEPVAKRIFFYDGVIKDSLSEANEMEYIQETAMSNGEFVPYIQPKFSLCDEKISGGEVLVRWFLDGKMRPPAKFIHIFENNGFITKLDMYMFEKTCEIIRSWLEHKVEPVTLSVNFSRLHLSNIFFVEQLAQISESWGVPKELLQIELTETAPFGDGNALIGVVKKIREAGFSFAIDDFGTGYSSLSMLKDIQADAVKLDRGFLVEYQKDERGINIIGSIIDLARRVKMQTVAEGVETKEQVSYLKGLRCDTAQGFYYAKPMQIDEMTKLLGSQ